MTDAFSTRVIRKIWTSLAGEEAWIRRTGDFRALERHSLIERPNYVYGMLRAADNARYLGIESVTVVEMGVASGAGLLNMIKSAELITRETKIAFRIVGFDTGTGLPSVEGYKDHPEIWNPGDFAMEERKTLEARIDGRAQIIWGDINTTIDQFTDTLTAHSPLGFVSVDVDIYSATRDGLRCLTGEPNKYLPAISMYFDDVSFFSANEWCGELAAINEFNVEQDMRKIGLDRSLPGGRPPQRSSWYQHMYVCHVLDHEARQTPKARDSLSLGEHFKHVQAAYL